jgi:hypothetical protein
MVVQVAYEWSKDERDGPIRLRRLTRCVRSLSFSIGTNTRPVRTVCRMTKWNSDTGMLPVPVCPPACGQKAGGTCRLRTSTGTYCRFMYRREPDDNSMHKSYVLGFFEIALQTVISSTLYQRIPVGSTEQPLHLPLVTNQKNIILCRSCVRDAPCLATSRR